jgi:uncharacterized membrane protein
MNEENSDLSDALITLKNRLEKGEITVAEFVTIKKIIEEKN